MVLKFHLWFQVETFMMVRGRDEKDLRFFGFFQTGPGGGPMRIFFIGISFVFLAILDQESTVLRPLVMKT